MNLAKLAIENRAVTYFAIFLIVAGGISSFFSLGQLEDPAFTVKTAVVTTAYPGASPEQVELEVTDRIEVAIQEMAEIDYLESWSRAGLSLIKVNIKSEYWSDRLPQVWNKLRAKVRDVESQLPPGTGRPDVSDDFGDVFGFQIALTAEGFSYSELEAYAKSVKKELSLVKGVARVDLWGVQEKAIYLDVAQTQLAELGITDANLEATLSQQNMVVDAGNVDLQNRRMRIAPSGEFTSPEEIADLSVVTSMADTLLNLGASVTGDTSLRPATSDEIIRIRDIGDVTEGYLDPPHWQMRFNGKPALGVSITNVAGANVVEVGRAIDQAIDGLMKRLPIGIELQRVHWMSDIVDSAVKDFLINFGEAVLIVLVIIAFSMGMRMGLIIGTALIATILVSFILMAILDIDLQRMSLGALVIALGMMVDNAIVVADGMAVRLQKGMDRTQAAIESAQVPSMPLLGATIIAVMAFYPIFASVEDAGEYCRTLFSVVAISLISSWIISMTVTPMQCIDMLPEPDKDASAADPYGSGFYRVYRRLVEKAIRFRWLTLGVLVVLLGASVAGFGQLKQQFFPFSSMTKFMVDVWYPEGTRIQDVAAGLEGIEQHLLADERVETVTSFIGQGPPRFYLPVDPEDPYTSYAQLIVNVNDYREIDAMLAELTPWFAEHYPDSQIPVRKYGVGPATTWKFQVRISGPAEADPALLRSYAEQGMAIVKASPLAATVRSNWRERTARVVPAYNQERARWANVTRPDVASATKRAFDGLNIGLYREQDDLIPIVLRYQEEDRANVGGLGVLQVQGGQATETVPLAQVTDGVPLAWEDPLVWRRDRRRTITIQSNPIQGETLPSLRSSVLQEFDRLADSLPGGYTLEWGGEHEDTLDAQASLVPGVVPAVAIMLFIIVMLFNAFRPLLVIVFTIPFALIGIIVGLMPTGTPFGFLALLGAMSLAGMMIKNAIVLLDQVNIEIEDGRKPYDAVLAAAASRLRPVILAAATTVLGVAPLLQDVFWIGMAITIMFGLTFGTILTMVMVPVLYATLNRLQPPEQGRGATADNEAAGQPA
jgi:multidrug efflux pump subunit AcrB